MPWWMLLTVGFVAGFFVWTPVGWGAARFVIHWHRTRRALHEARFMLKMASFSVLALLVVAAVGLRSLGIFS